MRTRITVLMLTGFAACILTTVLMAVLRSNSTATGRIANLTGSQGRDNLPHGRVIYSANSEAASGQIRSDLFLREMPYGKILRLTTAQSSPLSGGDVQQPKFSPDGRQVVFLDSDSDVPKLEREMYMGHAPDVFAFLNLWRLDVATSRVHPITQDGRGWHMACWSPDGTHIAAVRTDRVGTLGDIPAEDLYVFDARTWQKRRIVHATGPIFSVSWAGDSRSVLYQPTPNQIYQVSRQGKGKNLFAQGGHIITSYSLSPNGRYAALVQDNRLLLRSLTGSPTVPIIKLVGSEKDLTRGPSWSQPVWSHDGHRIAVCEVVTDKRQRLAQVRIYAYDISGRGGVIAVLPPDTPKDLSILSWSRDGRWLIVTGNPEFAHTELLAVSTQNGQVVTLKAPTEVLHGLDWHEIIAP